MKKGNVAASFAQTFDAKVEEGAASAVIKLVSGTTLQELAWIDVSIPAAANSSGNAICYTSQEYRIQVAPAFSLEKPDLSTKSKYDATTLATGSPAAYTVNQSGIVKLVNPNYTDADSVTSVTIQLLGDFVFARRAARYGLPHTSRSCIAKVRKLGRKPMGMVALLAHLPPQSAKKRRP